MFQAFALVWQMAQNGRLHKTGEHTIRAACTPQTVLDWLFWCLFCFFYPYLAIFPAVLLYLQQGSIRLHPQALTECSPLNFRRSSIKDSWSSVDCRVKSKETVGNSWMVLSYFGSKPKSKTKGEFFHIFLSLIVSSQQYGLQMVIEADEVLLGKRPR